MTVSTRAFDFRVLPRIKECLGSWTPPHTIVPHRRYVEMYRMEERLTPIPIEQQIQALRPDGGQPDVADPPGFVALDVRRIPEPVDLVEDEDRVLLIELEILQNLPNDLVLLLPIGVRGIDDVQREIGLHHFLKRRTKRRDQGMGKAIDESNGIGHGAQYSAR